LQSYFSFKNKGLSLYQNIVMDTDMDFLDVVKLRQSNRAYEDKEVEREKIELVKVDVNFQRYE
jgi:hypothetical protein